MSAGKSLPMNPRRGERQGTRVLTIRVAEKAGEALDWLAEHSVLGIDAEAVATYMLIRALDRRLRPSYSPSKVRETR